MFLLTKQAFDLEGIDEDLGVVNQKFCEDLDTVYLPDLWDFSGLIVLLLNLVVFVMGGSHDQRNAGGRYFSLSCLVQKVEIVK